MDPNKNRQGKIRSMIIGAFTVFGIAILVWAIFFFTPSVGDNKNKMTINFANIEGIDSGTRVTYAGKPVGEVVDIEYIPREDNHSVDSFGNPFTYAVTVKLDSSVHVYSTDLIVIKTSGLLGEKSIAIIPRVPSEGENPQSVLGGTIYANSEDPLSSTLKTVQEASEEITKVMATVSQILMQNQDLIHQSMQSLDKTLKNISSMIQYASQVDLIGNMNQSVINFGKMTQNLDQTLTQIKEMQVLEKVDATMDHLAVITENIAAGKGTLGKLVNDPTLYIRTLALIDRVNQLAYDLNHFGLLFHRNRLWKIEQSKRLEKMENLSTPTAFAEAFELDLDQVNEALDQVSKMVDQAEMGNEAILETKEFKRSFIELMHQVNRLQKLTELYNQKINKP